MDSNSCEKRLRNECIDRISNLPDSILGKILSYLPIKNVVATSILSTRWKTIFPHWVPLIELDFDDSYSFCCLPHNHRGSLSRKFMDFVDKLLNVTLRDVRCVERVVFNCEKKYGDETIVSWIRAALRLNVQCLRFMSYLRDSEPLFDSLNGCTTLVELGLGNSFAVWLPKEFILPNLKRLSLYSLVLRDDMESIQELIDGCPMLNDLRIIACNLSVVSTLRIQHLILNKLFIHCSKEWACDVVIDAPNLETLLYEGPFVANYVLKNNRSLHSVSIDFDYFPEETHGLHFHAKASRMAKLVKSCSSTINLCCVGNSMMALYRSFVPLPTFQNLTWLALGRMGAHGWRMLALFLKSAPNLTILTFEEVLDSKGDYSGCQSSAASLSVSLELNVKKIEIWEFECTPDEIKLIEYFLENGEMLQELIVHCLPCWNTRNLEKLSMLPRHSKSCQILLKDKTNQRKARYSRDIWF